MSVVKETALARLITKIKAFGNDNFIKYSGAQSLTDAQKLQARTNIGASTGAVKYDEAQSLTAAQKSQARTNIGAISQEESIVIDDEAPEDTSVKAWVDTSEGLLVDSGYVFGNVWDVVFDADEWTLSSGKYYQTAVASGLDHHFQLLTWIPDSATDAEYDDFIYVDSCYSTLDGSVTMVMSREPSVDLTVKVKYHESTEQKHFDDFQEKMDVVTLSLPTASWVGTASPYTQVVTISGSTANSKVDLQPDSTVIEQMIDDGVAALYVNNNNNVLTVYSVSEKPSVDISLQATVYEVSV